MTRRSFAAAVLALATVACSDAATSPPARPDRSPTSNVAVDDGQSAVFGPERFERSRSAPVRVVRTVSAAALASIDAPYTLRVVNGPPGTARASSAIVTIDGLAVVRASDLAPNVAALERDIEVKPGAEIVVELRGAPGSAIELTIRGVPKPETSPDLLTPASNVRILQNDQTTGCPASLIYGYGFRIEFSWTPATGPQAITGYELTAGYPGSFPILPGIIVGGTSYVSINCGFVQAAYLDGWEWRVRARYADGTFGPSSATGTFSFTTIPAPPVVLSFVQTPPSFGGAATRVSASGAVDATTSSSVRLTAVLDVPVDSTAMPYPFVEFFWINGATRQKIGDSAVTLLQTPTNRSWVYTFTWDPPPGTPIGTLSIVAVRTDFGGSTYQTPATEVTVVP